MLTAADAAPPATPPAAPQGKVELDLDGAPFLEEEPKPAALPKQATHVVHEELEQSPPPRSRKKLFIFIGLGLLLILGGVFAAVYFFFLRSPDGTVKADPGVEVVVVPSTPPVLPTAPVSAFSVSWPPFWVEVQDPEGELRLVYCKLTLLTDNQRIFMQIQAKNTTLRDAVYYFLRHKAYAELADMRRLNTLKGEILNVLNYYILPEDTSHAVPPPTAPGSPAAAAPPPAAPPVAGGQDGPKFERINELLIDDYMLK